MGLPPEGNDHQHCQYTSRDDARRMTAVDDQVRALAS